jgi:hypothetical protein
MKLALALLIAAGTLTACATAQPTNAADAARTAKAERIANRMDTHHAK